jgi:hypothetical protein
MMRMDLKQARSVEAAVFPSDGRWVAYCATWNLTGHGDSPEAALEMLRRELDDEERCPEIFEPSMGPPAPIGAEIWIVQRFPHGGWIL